MDKYVGWKLFEKVAIISKDNKYVNPPKYIYRNVDKYGHPQAYICDASDNKMMETGKRWAKWEEAVYGEDNRPKEYITHEPVISIMDNSGFTLELLDSADGSSQGGKLSFWNCLITKDDNSWVVGIHADYLLEIIKESTFVNGVCQTPLCFARCKGGVGMLSTEMNSYKQALADCERRSKMSKGKTTSRKEGHLYSTTTLNDVYLGTLYYHYEPVYERSYRDSRLVGIKRIEPLKVHWDMPQTDYNGKVRHKRSDFKDQFWVSRSDTATPARVDGGKVIDLDISLEEIIDYSIKDVLSYAESNSLPSYSVSKILALVGLSTSPDNYELSEDLLKLLRLYKVNIIE